jgi:hypothetical protein
VPDRGDDLTSKVRTDLSARLLRAGRKAWNEMKRQTQDAGGLPRLASCPDTRRDTGTYIALLITQRKQILRRAPTGVRSRLSVSRPPNGYSARLRHRSASASWERIIGDVAASELIKLLTGVTSSRIASDE